MVRLAVCAPVVLAAQANVVGSAVTALMVGAISLIVIVAVAVTGAGAAGGGGGVQQRSGNFLGRSMGGGGGVVSVTVSCTLNVPVLFGVNEKSGVLPPCAWPFSVHAY